MVGAVPPCPPAKKIYIEGQKSKTMKKLSSILVVLFCLCTLSSRAQSVSKGAFSFIPRVGIDFAKLSNHDIYSTSDFMSHRNKAQFKLGFEVGANVEYMALDNLGIELGFQYAREGTDHDMEAGELALDYINVPLMANIYVVDNLALRVGVQPGFLVGNDTDSGYGDDAFKKVDFSIPVGLSYEYENFILGVRYNIGLTRVFKNDLLKEKNQVFMVDLGYRISL